MERNVSCSLCGKEISDRFCICADLSPLGPACWETHLNKAKVGFHFALPLAAKLYVTPDNQMQFKHWLLALTNSQDKLKANLPIVDRCYADIQTAYEGLIQDLINSKDQVLSKVRDVKAALAVGIDQAIEETTNNAYRHDYQPSTYLAQQVWAHCCASSSQDLQIFRYEVKCTDERLRDSLEVTIQTAVPELAFSHVSGGAQIVQQLRDLLTQFQTLASTDEMQRLSEENTRLRDAGAALTKEIEALKGRCQGLEAEVKTLTPHRQEATQLRSQVAAPKRLLIIDFVAEVRIQAVLRGYLSRRQVKNRVMVQKSPSMSGIALPSSGPVRELHGEIPDYSNPATKSALLKCGPFNYNQISGDGVPVFQRGPVVLDNGIYIGEWNKSNQRHGRGEQRWTDGSRYEGSWKLDKANGKGRLIHADGDVYIGDWVDDKAHGFGVYLHADDAKYEGEWKNDAQDGRGVETWPDGARFEGSYASGKKNGAGCFVWANGDKYEGEFRENDLHGSGTYSWTDGRRYVGTYKNNKMDGRGVFTWNDGRRYEGEYVNDTKQGFGAFIWPDGRRCEGRWLNGKQHGRGVYTAANGQSREGVWEDGKWISWL